MKVEITHDILAKKVFTKLDAERKELLEIKGLISNRCKQDSSLNRKELKRIRPFLKRIQLTPKEKKFIRRSRNVNILNRAGYFLLLIIPLFLFLLYRSNNLADLRAEQQSLLSSYVIAKFDGNDQTALDSLKKYIEHPLSKTENILPFYLEMAALNLKKGKPEAAESNLQEAIEAAAPDEEKEKYYQVKKAQFYVETKQREKAQSLMKSISNIDSEGSTAQTDLQLMENFALIFSNLGRWREAKNEYEEILNKITTQDITFRNKILGKHAAICIANDLLQEAVQDYISILKNSKLEPNSTLSIDSLFIQSSKKNQLVALFKSEKKRLNLSRDSMQIIILDNFLSKMDPIAAIVVDTIDLKTILVSDNRDTVRFQRTSNGSINLQGKKQIENQYSTKDPVNRVLAATSAASLDDVNTYFNNLNFGAFQWNLGLNEGQGELPALLYSIKQADPDKFGEYFGKYQLDVSDDSDNRLGFLKYKGKKIDSIQLKQSFHTPEWAFIFWKAAQDPAIMNAQRNQMIRRLDNIRIKTVGGTAISQLITSEHGNAVLLAYSLVRPEDITARLRLAITAAGDDLSDKQIIEEFIKSWKEVGNAQDIDFRLSKLGRWKLKRTANSF